MSKHYSKRTAKELDRLRRQAEDGDVFESDAELIRDFIDHLDALDNADSTKFQYCSRLRTLSKRAEEPLTEYDEREIQDLMNSMATGDHPDVKDDGVKVANWKTALRKFDNFASLPFDPADIEVSDDLGRDLSPEDLLTQDEVDALLEACGPDLRYKALIAWGLATGQRLDAIRTVKIGDIEMAQKTGHIELNEEEGALKGAGGTVPLLWAKSYVEDWLEIHPAADDPDAALWCGDPRLGNTPGVNTRSGELQLTDPLHPRSIRGRLHMFAERAGIEPEKRVYPHLLRHSAITRMVLEGVPRQQIVSLVGWSGDSTQFETYQNLADELRNDALRKAMGLPTSEEDNTPVIGQPTLNECPKCGDHLPTGVELCRTCGTPMTLDADAKRQTEEKGPYDESIRGAYREAEDMDTVEKVQLVDELLNDDDVRAALELDAEN